MPSFVERLRHGWNAFNGRDHPLNYQELGSGSYYRQDHQKKVAYGNDKSIVTAVITRMSVDAALVDILHARVDHNGNYIGRINDDLNDCLNCSANIDQTSFDFKIDMVSTILSSGHAAIVPIETSIDPRYSTSYDIRSIRVGRVTQWYPQHVTVNVYDEKTGRHREITLPKRMVAIVTNPFYDVMNEPNSILQRLIRKLSLLDSVDEQTNAGKLDMIIQLPYVIKTDARREQAERRRKDIEMQLRSSKYGIAYTDGTEKIMQLNRPLENNLLEQIKFLTEQLFSELGITPEILNGTASDDVMQNYLDRTIEAILTAIADEFKRKFLTKTARTQGQSIVFIRNPFKLIPLSKIAEIADSFTRNAILSSNEIRANIGFEPSDDPMADQLINKNINPMEMGGGANMLPEAQPTEEQQMFDENQNGDEYIEPPE